MKYYLATNEVDVFHYGELLEGMEVSTGQPVSLLYNTKEELVTALIGYGQEYQDPQVIDIQGLEAPLAEPDGLG